MIGPRQIASMLGFRVPRLGQPSRRVARCQDLGDLRAAAMRRVPRPIFDYVDGGADDEVSLSLNREAFNHYGFTPRLLVDVGTVDTSTMLFGARSPLPLVLAPTGYNRMMHADGECAVARAAARHQLAYTLSTVASTSIEDVAATGHPCLWFQLYQWRDRDMTADMLRRAWDHGYRSLEVSVDVPVAGHRRRDVRNGLTIPPRLSPSALAGILARPRYALAMLRGEPMRIATAPPAIDGREDMTINSLSTLFDPTVSWDDMDRLREAWPGSLLVKGPLGPEDARRAVDAGVDGVHLSNHGGRQLDRTLAPLLAVADVREAIGEETMLIVDSGIRHGSDIAVAVALGADAGAVGRAYLYGLMAAGEAGVDHALSLLGSQFTRTMQLLGVTSVAELRAGGQKLLVDLSARSLHR